MITIIDNDNREWADAPDVDAAIFAMRHIHAEEDGIELRAMDENGRCVAWLFNNGAVRHDGEPAIGVIQRARSSAR